VTVIISKRETAKKTSLHPATVMRLARQGRFPKPVQLAKTRIGFVEREVDQWIEDRINEREVA
jgi:prophage regulatory protein